MRLQMLKRALISYVTNMGKAIWSAVAHPLTIKGKKNGNLIGYRMYGNSNQSGTPTYSSPKEIVSIGVLVTEGENAGKYRVPVKVSSVGKEKVVDIYLNEPLRRISSSANSNVFEDYIDYENQQVVRKVRREYIEKVDSKSSNAESTSVFLSAISKRPYMTSNMGYCISNKFRQSMKQYVDLKRNAGYIQTYRTSGGDNRVAYSFANTDENLTLQEARELIGDGFEVIYALYTPITESIELPPLPQFNGTTTYEVLTDAPPSGIEVCYYG